MIIANMRDRRICLLSQVLLLDLKIRFEILRSKHNSPFLTLSLPDTEDYSGEPTIRIVIGRQGAR